MNRFWIAQISWMALAALACDSDSPTSSSIAAPAIHSPTVGETVTGTRPTLTIQNAPGLTDATYHFEIASDASFGSVLAAEEAVAQGAGGTTSWQVPRALSGGQLEGGLGTYYWRARASAAGETGPWSPTAHFKIQEGFLGGGSSQELVVFDPLTNGSSVGRVSGGDFTPRGWKTTNATSFIRYEVPTIRSGYVEFDVTNLREPNPHSDKRMLIIMWDPSMGPYTTNPFRVHLQKLDRRTVDFGDLRLRWISRGQERNIYHNHWDWDPERIYNFRMEWGDFPNIDTQWGRVLFDGVEVQTWNYDAVYEPSPHWIELGGAPRNETLEQAIFSNLRVGRR